jgi:hypothetical protein
MNIRSGLAACAAIAAVAAAIAGCGSSGSSTPGGSAGGAVAASAKPTWASALGSGVTLDAPGSASPGNGSPQAVVAGIAAAENSGNYASACNYYMPDMQSQCKSQISAAESASPSAVASAVGHATNFGIGYTAIHGTEALVGTTGTFCASGSCFTNSDPAAIFSTAKSFSDLWNDAVNSGSSNSYSLATCTEIDGKWYIYSPPSS